MHFYTTIYGNKYLPFLRVLLTSLQQHHAAPRITVQFDEISPLEEKLLRRTFPSVHFELVQLDIASASDKNRRISMYLRYWSHFLENCEVGAEVCLMDCDMMVMQPLDGALPSNADVVYTWKVERFPINGGIILVRNTAAVNSFFDAWLQKTEAIMADEEAMNEALQLFGAADQFAFAKTVATNDYTSPCTRSYADGEVRFAPAPCAVINQTNSKPITPETKVYHLKSGWHNILLEDGPYTKWRTQEDSEEVHRYWKQLDIESTIEPWRQYVNDAVDRKQGHYPQGEDHGYMVRGIINSEMLSVIALVHDLEIDVIIESGRYLGQSTKMLCEGLKHSNCIIESTEWVRDEIADEAEERLKDYKNLKLHYGDAGVVVPEVLSRSKGKRIAILLDGPKGPEAFDIFSDAIANHENVVIGFIHDLRDSHPGMLNPNRVYVHEWFERIFFTDDAEYLERFAHYDDTCQSEDVWKPNQLFRQTIGSHGPTLGIMLPTHRDRYRAQKRIAQRDAAIKPVAEGVQPATTVNPLKKLHRIPGFSASKKLIKKGLRRDQASSPEVSHIEPTASNELARKTLSELVTVGPGDIVIDCGANVGQEVEAFIDSGAMIYAFEPNPDAFHELSTRFADRVNLVCFPFAVLDRNDSVRLFMHEHSAQDPVKWSVGSSLLEFKGNVTTERYADVKAIDLSEFIYRLVSRVKLLKMDIEGAEYETLTRLIERGLTSEIDHIVVETHQSKIPELQNAHDELLSLIERHEISNIDLGWI